MTTRPPYAAGTTDAQQEILRQQAPVEPKMKKLPFTELIETINRFERKRFASKNLFENTENAAEEHSDEVFELGEGMRKLEFARWPQSTTFR